MKNCHHLDGYIDNRLSADARQQFERHLASCSACSQSIAIWNRIGAEIKGIGQQQIAAMDPSPAFLAMRHQRKFLSTKTVVKWAVAAAVLVGLAVFIFVGQQAPEKVPSELEPPSFAATFFEGNSSVRDVQVTAGTPIQLSAGLRAVVHLQQDEMGIKTGSTAIIEKASRQETVVHIKSGTLAFQVHRRAPKHPFVIHAGRYRVKVVGTQFSVALKEGTLLDVVVKEGIVEVTDTAHRHSERILDGRKLIAREGEPPTVSMATADDTLEIDVLLGRAPEHASQKDVGSKDIAVSAASPANLPDKLKDRTALTPQEVVSTDSEPLKEAHRNKRDVKNASVATWQQWVLEGRVDDAETALQAYLRHTTGNAEAWFLLADCQKRKKEYRQAVATYQKAIPHVSQRAGQTARYRAAAILQDNLGAHRDAILLLEKFLNEGKPSHQIEAEAMLRLGVSLRAVGETDRATNLFRQIVANHGATSAATRARKFLE
ncbi:MAG: tetratricopeptide repeat protein [Deltaproteobacteria bacterium]|nr:tetratricopeptide repeat protein [Deltaproteobacteria bacterium]